MALAPLSFELARNEKSRFRIEEQMDLQLKGKKALVFGSSAGIGRAIAESLIAEGASVALSARTQSRLAETAAAIGAAAYFPCDLSKPGAAKETTQQAASKLGGLDILVINSGGPKKNVFADVSQSQWLEDFQNLWLSAVDGINAVLPGMKERSFGRILLVTSLAAKEPLPGLTSSNGLRAGLAGLAKSLANEVAASGITINLILPGYTDTERLKELNLSEEKIRQLVPAGRLAAPSELGDLAAFLASPRAGYITAQSIVVDGGALRGH